MKRIIILVIIIIIISSCTHREPCQYIYNSNEQRLTSMDSMINIIGRADIVFFGEQHDDSITHILQHEVYEHLLRVSDCALGLEMFERDVQYTIDRYLSDSLSEIDFLRESRPWNNYPDYRPLMETAKSRNMPVIALNVPRYIAAAVAKNGIDILDTFPHSYFSVYKEYSEDYRNAFNSTMEHMSDNAPMKHMPDIDKLFSAQVLKDATMAQTIMDFMKKEDMKLFVLCGAFHSNYDMGIIEQLQFLGFEGSIVSIAVIDSLCSMDDSMADFILVKELHELR